MLVGLEIMRIFAWNCSPEILLSHFVPYYFEYINERGPLSVNIFAFNAIIEALQRCSDDLEFLFSNTDEFLMFYFYIHKNMMMKKIYTNERIHHDLRIETLWNLHKIFDI